MSVESKMAPLLHDIKKKAGDAERSIAALFESPDQRRAGLKLVKNPGKQTVDSGSREGRDE
jgi:hypothetical protein